MSTTHISSRRVLFVDDEPAFLELLGEAMKVYSGGNWEIDLATTTSKALAILEQKQVHLVVVDIHMPVVDGIQFLKLLQRKYPNIPRAVLTGDASEDHRSACLANGVELFLEKPRTPEGLEVVHATLNELARWQPESGFQGVLRRVGLQDVLQMECLARSSIVLEITAKGETGTIFIEQGSIVHSQVRDLRGEQAFNHLLSLSGGQFNLKGFSEPPERSISGSWEFLLMEAARMRDEELNLEAEGLAATAAVAAAAAAVAEPILEVEEMPPDDLFSPMTPAEAAIQEAALAETTSMASVLELATEAMIEVEAISEDDESRQPTPPAPPKIEEFLICTPRGDIILQWQCDNASDRVSFMEFIRQKSRQVCQGLPIGALERLELEGAEARMVVRMEGEQSCLLRTLREKPGIHVEPVGQ